MTKEGPKEAYDKVELLLSDGTEVTLRPLVIGRLRRFMKAFDEGSNAEAGDFDANYDVYVNCVGICLEGELKDQFPEGTKGTGGAWLSDEYREYLEDTVDMETVFKVIEVCAGMKLNDPNLLRALAEAQATEKAGTA